jgi:hypothetical protein
MLSGTMLMRFDHPSQLQVWPCCFLNADTILFGHEYGEISSWSLGSGQLLRRDHPHTNWITTIITYNELLVTASFDNSVCLLSRDMAVLHRFALSHAALRLAVDGELLYVSVDQVGVVRFDIEARSGGNKVLALRDYNYGLLLVRG